MPRQQDARGRPALALATRAWISVGLGVALLVAGCGGGASDDETATGAPTPNESLEAAAKRLEGALADGDCEPLADLLLHSAVRGQGVDPSDPATAQECRYVRDEAGNVGLLGFKVRKAEAFGPAGISDGSGDHVPEGGGISVAWVLDVDGSWKAVFDAALKQAQAGVAGAPDRFDANARAFVAAAAAKDCDRAWRLLNVVSRFVRSADGHKAAFCETLARSYEDEGNGLADLAAHPDAQPELLGVTPDIAFYGLEIDSGRYQVLVLTGRIGGVADQEQREHDDPSVVEFVTVRRPD